MTRRTLALVVLGLVLLVGGVMVARQPRAFGWVAYTPLSREVLSPGAIVLDRVGIAALGIAGLGVAVVAGVVGYALGRRQDSGPPSGAADGDE
ncbi:hypothetical protein [Georgenia ruanii]|uniref:hypothetical protein n=1 Tax=Georgenia ruanii TaxID=348442 RepID=UPI001264131B|nr:hypothetical protein [Georgenia ruanii]